MNKSASCGRAEQRYIQCHVRVKIVLPVYGNWMLASPCRNASADGAAMSKGSRLFHSLMVYEKKEYWKAKILALGCSSVALSVRRCKVKEPSRFFPFLPRFLLFFPDFSLFFPIFGIYFAVRGGTLPPLTPPSGYATAWLDVSLAMASQGVNVPTISDGKVVSNRDVHNKCDNIIKYQYLCSCPSMYPTVAYLIACY